MNKINSKIKPFLKWPGGKRWIFSNYGYIFPTNYNNYYEPFLGGGSVFFSLKPRHSILSDLNSDLINLYVVMRDNPIELKNELISHQNEHNSKYYYAIRESTSINNISAASRFLYLNRTCFNGMYRVNKNGVFNVPIGTKCNILYDIDKFEIYSNILKNGEILSCDFSETIQRTSKNDLLFVDPPYATLEKSDGFIKYNDKLFTWNDQLRLFNSLLEARKRGVKIISTNVYHENIIEIYKQNNFFVKQIYRHSTLSSKTSSRRSIGEALITSFNV